MRPPPRCVRLQDRVPTCVSQAGPFPPAGDPVGSRRAIEVAAARTDRVGLTGRGPRAGPRESRFRQNWSAQSLELDADTYQLCREAGGMTTVNNATTAAAPLLTPWMPGP